jgi:hypothetical protein
MPSDPYGGQWSGLRLASDFPVPELLPAVDGDVDWRLCAAARRLGVGRWYHHWRLPDGRRWLSFAKLGDDYLLRFARSGAYLVSPASRTIECDRRLGVPMATLRHLLLNQVLPLAAGLTRIVLHASAVRTSAGVVAFAGAGGVGKSTLAAALCRRGAALVSDDALAVVPWPGGWAGVPSYPSVRLWPESLRALFGADQAAPRAAHYTPKRRLHAPGVLPVETRTTPLAAICLLDGGRGRPSADATMERVAGPDALVALLSVCFQIDVRDRGRLAALTTQLADVVEAVPVFRLTVPEGLARLDAVAGALESLAPLVAADVA